MLNTDLLVRKELTNMGAWFSANMYSQYYILQDCNSGTILSTYKLNNFNWQEALHNVVDDIECYGQIVFVCYWHAANGFKVTIEDNETHINRSFFLLRLEDIIEVN